MVTAESKPPADMQTGAHLPAATSDEPPEMPGNMADDQALLPAEPLVLGETVVKRQIKPAGDPQPAPAQPSAVPADEMAAATKPPADSSEALTPAVPEKSVQDHLPSPQTPDAETHVPEIEVTPAGVALVAAVMGPLAYELNDRSWGWRPNDIINITDNVNNFQLGVLEVTRRAIVQLAQRISRTGSTDAFDPHLENAMNWIMTKATSRWFPSAESKYKESLKELAAYKTNLAGGNGHFYTRADNLIPLLEVFEDLLGSCDQNLVMQLETDGTAVSTFKADDYFYYAKGVAHAMAVILEGVQIDFAQIMENRRSAELLHHAIESCQQAAQIEPWMVTNADLDGILANHRANMAAPISHARYFLGQLVMALST